MARILMSNRNPAGVIFNLSPGKRKGVSREFPEAAWRRADSRDTSTASSRTAPTPLRTTDLKRDGYCKEKGRKALFCGPRYRRRAITAAAPPCSDRRARWWAERAAVAA